MDKPKEINIEEQSTRYEVSTTYHSYLKCENYDASITAFAESDGTITLEPRHIHSLTNDFVFKHSDPDRVIAIAEMIKAFAEMVKKENQ